MKNIKLLDGAIGQELVRKSRDKATVLWSAMIMLERPELLEEVHSEYFAAGATIATTNTYAVLEDRLIKAGWGNRCSELWEVAINLAKSARKNNGFGLVAGSIGPLIASYRPEICPPPNEAKLLYKDIVAALSTQVDLFIIETMSSIDQAKGALKATQDSRLPVWLGFTVDDFDGTKLRSGEKLSSILEVLEEYRPDAVLLNCSRPEAISEGIKIIRKFGVPFGAYANGFTKITNKFLEDNPTVDALHRRMDLSPVAYADFATQWLEDGATILGGCCEVGPAHIEVLAERIKAEGYSIT